MRSNMRRTILPVLLLLSGTTAAAVWQYPTAAAPEAPKPADPRLNQSLTLDLTRVPLSDLCWVIEQRTGVPHRPADTATGDLLANVVGTLTVSQLHQALVEVLGVGWKPSGEGEAAGYMVECLPGKLLEEAWEQAETDRAFGDALRSLMAAANLPEGAENPLSLRQRRWLERPARRAALQVLGALTPAEQALVLAGGSVDRTVASLSPETQVQVKKLADDFVRGANREADRSLAEPGGLRLRRWEPLDLENGDAWRIQFSSRSGFFPSGTAIFSVRVFSPKEFGIGFGSGVPMSQPGLQDPARYRLPVAGPSPEEPTLEPPLPDQFRLQGKNWEEVARDLARKLGRPVLSDAYRLPEVVFAPPGSAASEEKLEIYLDRACRDLNRRWGQAGPVLLFRRCDWATLRRAQIPESQVRRWKQHVIDTGQVSFDHLVEMTALTPYQLPNLGTAIGPQADRVRQHQELLLFWKDLPEAQCNALRSEGRVIRDLPLTVQPRARALVSGMLGSSAPLVLSNARLRAEQTEEAFTFSVLSPDRPAAAQRVELTCPEWFREQAKKDEAIRAAALRAAALESPPPAAAR